MTIPPEELKIEVYDPDHSGWVVTTVRGVRVTHLPTGTMAQYGQHRSQHYNRQVAIEMIELALAKRGDRT